jgi:hypothetical protein
MRFQNMRMACNSTWLIDHETDYGHKVDERMTLLDELLLSPPPNCSQPVATRMS